MGQLVAESITKEFSGGVRALDGVGFTLTEPRTLTLLGPSGCGKSTLLRIIAGLEKATSGSLTLDGKPLDLVPPGERQVGFVFQNYALYPHMTVAENLGLALRVRGVNETERSNRISQTATMLGIGHLLDRRPRQLSGGQQQRVALGRALIREPRLYLLDEPLSNLDAALREDTRGELKSLFERLRASVIYVTHDQSEAMSLSDEVAVMHQGRILQSASPLEVYQHPNHLFVATFVGSPRMNTVDGVLEGNAIRHGTLAVFSPVVQTSATLVTVGIRPEDVEVSAEVLEGGWECERSLVEPMGSHTLLTTRLGDTMVRAMTAPRDWPARLWMRWPTDRLHVFERATGQRID